MLKTLAYRVARAGCLPGLLRRTLSGREKLRWDRVKFGPYAGTRKDMGRLLHPDVHDVFEIDRAMMGWLELAASFGTPIDSDALIRADLWTYLSENCLIKTDRASMAHSLEVRVPMLGNPVVDLAVPQPASVKLHGGRTKAALRVLAERHLPPEVWDRPKHGFSVPLGSYFQGAWRDRCEAWVADCEHLAPFLNAKTVRCMWQQTCRGRGEMRSMYTVIVLLAWLERISNR